MKTNFFILLAASLVLFSCEKQPIPYAKFKNLNKDIDKDTVGVSLNSNYDLSIDSGYENEKESPLYLIQKNSDDLMNITDSSFVKKTKHGWNGKLRVYFEVMKIDLSLEESTYQKGDYLKVISRHGNKDYFKTIKIR